MNNQLVSQLILILILGSAFYLLLLRPQIRRQKEREALISSVKKGDEIITVGGIFGTIADIKGEKIVLEVAKDINLQISKSAVGEKINT